MNHLKELCYNIEYHIKNSMLLDQDSTSDEFIKKFLYMISYLKQCYDIGNQFKKLKEHALEVSNRQKVLHGSLSPLQSLL